jgi:hypothetical protein
VPLAFRSAIVCTLPTAPSTNEHEAARMRYEAACIASPAVRARPAGCRCPRNSTQSALRGRSTATRVFAAHSLTPPSPKRRREDALGYRPPLHLVFQFFLELLFTEYLIYSDIPTSKDEDGRQKYNNCLTSSGIRPVDLYSDKDMARLK